MTAEPLRVHQFDQSLSVEKKWAPRLDQWARDSFYEVREATEQEQWSGIDRVMTHPEDGVITVDYKCCERAKYERPTGNLFIETVSNDRTMREGWALTSRANFLLYFAVPDEVFVFDMKHLREILLPVWRKPLPHATLSESVIQHAWGASADARCR